MHYLGFVLVLLAALAPLGAVPLCRAQIAPAYAAMLVRGHQ